MEPQTQDSPRSGTYKELNGVNLDAFHEAVNEVRVNPRLAVFKFRASNEWINGGINRSTIKPFYGKGKELESKEARFMIEGDEPEVFLGTDTAPNPVEYVLHALLGDMTTALIYHSAASGISIKSLKSNVEADLDIQGFLGLSKTTKKGYKEIRVKFVIETNAQESDLKQIIKYSPVYEMISAGVPIKVEFEIKKPVLS